MKLISKFHDYYDTALGFGIDPNVVYKRDSLTIDHPLAKELIKFTPAHNSRGYYSQYDDTYKAEPFIIGFCGKVYLGYFMRTDKKEWGGWKEITRICYTIKEIEEFFIDNNLNTAINKFHEDQKKSAINAWWSNPFREWSVTQTIDKLKQNQDVQDVFVRYKVPVFLITNDDKLTLNPALNKYEFYKVVDAYTAFQEISQYMSGVLGTTEQNLTIISDKELIKKRGFDKHSFRKPKKNPN